MIIRRIALCVLVLIALASYVIADDATMFRYDPVQSGYTPEQIKLPLSLAWEYSGAKMTRNIMTPTVEGDILIFASDDRIYGLDRTSGAELWKYPSDKGLKGKIRRTPAIVDGKVYFGCGDSNVYCLNASDGSVKWIFGTKGPVKCAPIVSDGVVYVGSDDNCVYALDAKTGSSIWPKPFEARDDMSNGLVVGSGMVIGICGDGNLYGIAQNSGKPRWKFKLPSANTDATPVIIDNVAIMAISNFVYGINIRGGQQRWSLSLPDDIVATPTFKDSDMYVPCKDGNIYCYTVTSHGTRKKWDKPIKIDQAPAGSSVIAGNTLIQPGRLGLIVAMDTETGKIKWKYMVARPTRQGEVIDQTNNPAAGAMGGGAGGGMMGGPMGGGGKMGGGPGEGMMGGPMGGGIGGGAAGSAQDLGPITNISLISAYATPVVAKGALYLVSEDGILRCFTADSPDQEAPMILDLQPKNGLKVSATPPLSISAILFDEGSGVDYSKITLTHYDPDKFTNGEKLNFEIDDLKSKVKYTIMPGASGLAKRLLPNGIHTLKLTVFDYAGNSATKEWSFVADSSLAPTEALQVDKTAPTTNPRAARGTRGTRQQTPSQGQQSGFGGFDSPPPPPPPMPAQGN